MGEHTTRNWLIGLGTATAMGAVFASAVAFGLPRTDPAPPPTDDPALQLVSAGSCDALTQRLRRDLPAAYDRQVEEVERNRPPWWQRGSGGGAGGAASSDRAAAPAPAPGAAAPEAGKDYSTTNNQEAGVDEADVVKTDGRIIVSIHGYAKGRTSGATSVLRVTGTQPLAPVGTLDISGASNPQLFLDGDLVTVVSGGHRSWREPAIDVTHPSGGAASVVPAPRTSYNSTTTVTVVSISDQARPRVVRTMQFEGRAEAARSVNGNIRLVMVGEPAVSASPYAADPAAVRARLARTEAEDWLPRYAIDEGEAHTLGTCPRTLVGEVTPQSRPTSVVTLDPRQAEPLGVTTVLERADTVYATTDRVYLAGTRWSYDPAIRSSTVINAVSVARNGDVKPVGQTQLDGTVKDQFALSEYQGHLRVASTVRAGAAWWPAPDGGRIGPDTDNLVTVFSAADLRQVGQVRGMGKPGESIHGVRFLGDKGYVVTFQRTDPLYVLDLRNPARPAITGELSIPGYSAYLHPIDGGRLIGVGADADPNSGRVTGTKVSLYDVNDPAQPRELSTVVYPSQRSAAEFDHHAFLWWGKTGHVVVPLYNRSVALKVDGNRLSEAGSITQPAASTYYGAPRRSLVIGDQLYTVGDQGIRSSEMRGFTQTGWAAFR